MLTVTFSNNKSFQNCFVHLKLSSPFSSQFIILAKVYYSIPYRKNPIFKFIRTLYQKYCTSFHNSEKVERMCSHSSQSAAQACSTETVQPIFNDHGCNLVRKTLKIKTKNKRIGPKLYPSGKFSSRRLKQMNWLKVAFQTVFVVLYFYSNA